MPKSVRGGPMQWGGLNKRVDPVDLSPEQSPDCANVFFADQTLGLLGPRMGKAYAGSTNYNIWGLLPYNIGGQVGALVAYGDNTSTEIDLLTLYSVTYPHSGWGDAARSAPSPAIPATITRYYGFYVSWTPSEVGVSPLTDTVACSVDTNGALYAIATLQSGIYPGNETVAKVYLQFDDGAWELCATRTTSSSYGGGRVDVVDVPTPVSCTGKNKLTGIKCTATVTGLPGTAIDISGDVRVMGVGKERTAL